MADSEIVGVRPAVVGSLIIANAQSSERSSLCQPSNKIWFSRSEVMALKTSQGGRLRANRPCLANQLLSSVYVLDAVTLVLKGAAVGASEVLPAVNFALVLRDRLTTRNKGQVVD
jgi:hypothetical protein